MSHEHFTGKFEVELKYRLASKTQFMKVLNSLEYEVMFQDNTESDVYFDSKKKHLQTENKSVCIREIKPSGIKLWVVKGPEPDRCQATNITNAENARSMLKTMGYEIALEMEKTRSIYFIGKFHITVDHLAGVGDFAEFAIMTDEEELLETYRKELAELADKFGLSEGDIETHSYRELQSKLLVATKL